MKNVLIFFGVALIASCVSAQSLKEKDVPAPVVAAAHKMFPEVKDYEWSMENGNYEAEYNLNKMEAAASFDASGNLLETEKEIAVQDLPAGVADYIFKNYEGAKIKEATEITDNKGNKTFEAEIKHKDLIFDTNGKFIREETD